MHECSIVQEIVNIASDKTREYGPQRVEQISLVVGELTGFREEWLQFYFDVIAKGTAVEGARLNVTYVKPQMQCSECGMLFERERFSFDCPECKAPGVMTKIGSELYIDTMELADSPLPGILPDDPSQVEALFYTT